MMTDWEIRDFVANLRLSSFPLSEMRDHELVELIEEGIKRGDLVAVKKVDPAVLANRPVDPAVMKLRLIREIESKTGGKLTESGRHYRLIRDIDFERFPERNYYHVVRQDEAKQILDALAKQPGTSAELAELFGKGSRPAHARLEFIPRSRRADSSSPLNCTSGTSIRLVRLPFPRSKMHSTTP
jgi:hypothetical protein